MKAVFSGAQLAHAPSKFLQFGNLTGFPDSPERARKLLEGARIAQCRIFGARKYAMSHFGGLVHNGVYLDFLVNGYGEWTAVPGAAPEMMPSLRPTVAYRNAPKHILGRAGVHQMDFSCPIGPSTWASAAASAMTAMTAADFVLAGDPVVYALCRPPGHHACADRASGFCYLNNAALAATRLRTVHGRVAILDIDVHHGNGTQFIFYSRDDVLFVSIHVDPREYYPFYWGYANETGRGAGEGFTYNIPLPLGSGDGPWLAAIDLAIARIHAFAPGALVLSLGLDAHESDPLKGGTVTTAGYARMASNISRMGLPAVIVQEGGYLTEHLADNLAMFLVSYEGGG